MRRLFMIIFVLVIAAGWVAAALYMPYGTFPAGGIYVAIPHGASTRAIASLLESNGVVRSRVVFEGFSRWHAGTTLQAGEYFFDHAETTPQVFDTIANGRVFVRELVIPEGYSMFDIADLVAREDFMTREDFLAAAHDASIIRDIAPGVPSLAGFLFPATYQFPRHPSAAQMITAMVDRFRQEWNTIAAQGGSVST